MKSTADIIIDRITSFSPINENGFDVIKQVVNLYNKIGFTKDFYKVFFILLENRNKFEPYIVL